VRSALEKVDGINQVLGELGKRQWRLDHPLSGELVAVAERDSWFPYYWWYGDTDAPPFARTIDIHRKPGYDPVELFLDKQTRSIPLKPEWIKGSHGVLPTTNEDLVSIIATGPSSELLGTRKEWEARDIPLLLLNLLGHRAKSEDI
jgi:hypothetical protein